MKYTSALFLVLLLVPIAFAQSDVIEMIEKSPEGKEVLDNLFLEVALEGANLNVRNVKARINALEAFVVRARKAALQQLKVEQVSCRNNLKAARGRFHDFTARALWARRNLAHVRRAQQKRGLVLQRSSQLFQMATKFRDMARENGQAWAHFWNVGRANLRKVASLISQVRAHVRKLHRRHHRAALIELPGTFKDAMAELTTQFETNFDNLGGLRPVISNLLEIVRSPVHIQRPAARVSIRRILGYLAYRLHEDANLFSEEHEHQSALFSSLVTLFEDGRNRESKVIKVVSAQAKHFAKKINWMNVSLKAANQFTQHARNIVDVIAAECVYSKHAYRRLETTGRRVLNNIMQVQEVIADRWPTLKAYFIEKIESIEEDKDDQ